MIAAVLLAVLFFQDGSIEQDLRALSHEYIAIREAATARLKKTPLSQLHLLDPHLKHSDGEVRLRVLQIMEHVISSALGLRKSRFELRPVATPEVMKAWIDQGADNSKPPKNYDSVRLDSDRPKPGKGYELYERDWILLESAVVTEDEVELATPEPTAIGSASWQVRFRLNAAGAERFDNTASTLFKREPKGMMAIVVDGMIMSAPIVQSDKFGGQGVIVGGHNETAASNLASILKGQWLNSFAIVEPDRKDAAPRGTVTDKVRKLQGLSAVSIKENETGFEIRGLVDLKNIDLVGLWRTLRDQGYRITPKK